MRDLAGINRKTTAKDAPIHSIQIRSSWECKNFQFEKFSLILSKNQKTVILTKIIA